MSNERKTNVHFNYISSARTNNNNDQLISKEVSTNQLNTASQHNTAEGTLSQNMIKKQSITLIGMPGAGKSTIGVILAKMLALEFIDTDVLIQTTQQKTLQQILDESGHLTLREIEADVICSLQAKKHVISTGGSAPYSEKAMNHLREQSLIVFLEVAFEDIKRRIHNFDSRGIAREKHQSLEDVFIERQELYHHYADITVNCTNLTQDELAERIAIIFTNPQSS